MNPKQVLSAAVLAWLVTAQMACAQQRAQRSPADTIASEVAASFAVIAVTTECSPIPLFPWETNIDVPIEWRLASGLARHPEMMGLAGDRIPACTAHAFRPTAVLVRTLDSVPRDIEMQILNHIKAERIGIQEELVSNREFTLETAAEAAKIIARLKHFGIDQAHATIGQVELTLRQALASRQDLLKAWAEKEQPPEELTKSRARVKAMLQDVGAGKT